ncbi:MAG: hypothetical protein PUE63_08380 [Lachnospiraceae bacterium]|nr:hypothetical protein [Lachnospiraceae bacterium]
MGEKKKEYRSAALADLLQEKSLEKITVRDAAETGAPFAPTTAACRMSCTGISWRSVT